MTDDLTQACEEDSLQAPSFNDMDRLQQLINKQLAVEEELAEMEVAMSAKGLELRRISEEEIPALFQQLHIEEFKLEDGSKVSVKPFYSASISPENQLAAFAWLRDHGLDDVIKHNIITEFGRGEDEAAENLKRKLEELQVNYVEKAGVHPQTLKALVREQIETMSERLKEGEPGFPMELFNVFIGHKTNITKPKTKKGR